MLQEAMRQAREFIVQQLQLHMAMARKQGALSNLHALTMLDPSCAFANLRSCVDVSRVCRAIDLSALMPHAPAVRHAHRRRVLNLTSHCATVKLCRERPPSQNDLRTALNRHAAPRAVACPCCDRKRATRRRRPRLVEMARRLLAPRVDNRNRAATVAPAPQRRVRRPSRKLRARQRRRSKRWSTRTCLRCSQ